jgi:hypothetical protein
MFAELTRRTQEKHLWKQRSHRSSELLKGAGGRARPVGDAPGNAQGPQRGISTSPRT